MVFHQYKHNLRVCSPVWLRGWLVVRTSCCALLSCSSSLYSCPAVPPCVFSALKPCASLLWPVRGGPRWSLRPSQHHEGLCLRSGWGEEADSPGWDWHDASGRWKAHIVSLIPALACHSWPLGPQGKGWRFRQAGMMGRRGCSPARTVLRQSSLPLRSLPPSGPLQGQTRSGQALLPAGKAWTCFFRG